MKSTLCAPALLAVALSASAQSFSFDSSLSNSDFLFNRPTDSGTALSVIGTSVLYKEYAVSLGSVSDISIAVSSRDIDTFIAFYRAPFDRTDPMTNLLAVNDDSDASTTDSRLELASVPAGAYVLVVTSFDNVEVGDYHLDATLTAVPEPSAWATVAGVGLLGLGIWRRRRA